MIIIYYICNMICRYEVNLSAVVFMTWVYSCVSRWTQTAPSNVKSNSKLTLRQTDVMWGMTNYRIGP